MRAGAFIFSALVVLATGCAPEAAKESGVEGRGAETAAWRDALPRPEWRAYERVLEDLEWFEAYRVFPDVYAIYEPGQFEEVISFLIVGDARALLFDTGLGVAPIAPVVARLTDRDVTVLNSHSHYDHVGGNHEFGHIAGLDNAYGRDHAQGAGNEIVGEFMRGEWVWKPTPEGFDPGTYEIKPYAVTQIVSDGDIIDLGGVRLEVLETPGHAPDSLCLFDRKGRRLFTGDTFYLAPLYAHLEGSDFEQYRASAERLAALEPAVDNLLTSHNVPVAESAYLSRMNTAFNAIAAGDAAYVETDGAYEYAFDGFSIIAPPRQ